METIRYHPLVDMSGEGTEMVPLFCSHNEKTIRQTHDFYLSETIPHYYRLCSSEPTGKVMTNRMTVHCPSCGMPMQRMSQNTNYYNHGLYTCDWCSRK